MWEKIVFAATFFLLGAFVMHGAAVDLIQHGLIHAGGKLYRTELVGARPFSPCSLEGVQ